MPRLPASLSQPLSLELVARLTTAVLVVLLVLAAVAMGARVRLLVRLRREREVTATWRPHVLEALLSTPADLPRLRRRLGVELLRTWCAVQQQVRGDARVRLDELALRVGLDGVARNVVRRRHSANQVLGVTAAGRLRLTDCWDEVKLAVSSPERSVQLEAATALVRIDARRGLDEVGPVLLADRGLHTSTVATVLLEAGAPLAARYVLEQLRDARGAHAAWLIRVFGHLRVERHMAKVMTFADGTGDAEVLAAVAQVVGELAYEPARPLVLGLLDHPAPFVRLRAVIALGRIAAVGDERRLLNALSDKSWWVRYRSAQALVRLPFLVGGEVGWWADHHADRYACDAIELALLEVGRDAPAVGLGRAA